MKKTIFILLVLRISIYSQVINRLEGSPYPASAKPDTLYSVTDINFSLNQLITIETLQGILAQTKPRIYRISSPSYMIWLNDLKKSYGVNVLTTYDGNFTGLIEHFKDQIKNYIVCDLQDNSVNAAISLCGITNSVAITQDNIALFESLGIHMLADVRGKDDAWFFNNYGALVNKNIFCFQKESLFKYLADYSVFGKMITFYNSSFDSSANRIYDSFNPNAALLGWGFDEFQLVQQSSNYNVFVNAADQATNISTLTNFNVEDKQKKTVDSVLSKENVHTVCFLMTDGDNVQWTLSGFLGNKWYGSSDRGRLKLGWTVSPALCELAPTVLKYFYDNETSGKNGGDYFVAGASGLGYEYPDKYQDLDGYAKLTSEFMGKADLRIMNIIGNNDSTQYLAPFMMQNNIDAIFYYFFSDYSGGRGKIKWVDGKPVIYGRYNLWDGYETPASLAQILNSASKNIYSSDGYSLIPVHAWSRSVSDVLSCIQQLDSTVRVVTPDEFVSLIKENLGPRTKIFGFIPNNSPQELSYIVPGDTGTMHNSVHRWANYSDKIIYQFNLDTLLSMSGGDKNLFLNCLVGNEYLISVASGPDGPWTEVFRWSSDSTKHIHDLSNFSTLTVNIQKYFDEGWHKIYLKFEDGIKSDGYGASVFNVYFTMPQVVTAVKNISKYLPQQFELEQNYPNPFNPTTVIGYQLSSRQGLVHVTLKVYNMLGREVATLINGEQTAGYHEVKFDGTKLSSGVYFYCLSDGNNFETKKMLLIK
ncbi:MAG: T9SS type A sorting domain-containing protein [Bacteroidetes bacterium]|nr:T9SS type A sorting domain-containing protein [Bacteroidota bacterium]